MKVLVPEKDNPSQLTFENREISQPDPHEIQIDVRGIGINRADLLQKMGKYPPPPGASDIIGLEVSGVVEKVGEKVTLFQSGEEVYCLLAGGGYAEKVNVHEQLVLKKPKSIDLLSSAGIAEVFLTAYQALFSLGNLSENENVLIHAGASGVGTAAIQLAKQKGARVWVTAGSREKLDFCYELGADHMINYREKNFADVMSESGADVILDFIGAPYFDQNLRSIKPDGRWIVLAFMGGNRSEIDLAQVLMKRVHLMGSTLRARDLNYKSQLIADFSNDFGAELDTGRIKPVIDRFFDWKRVNDAHRYMESNLNKGKILLERTDH